MNNPFKITRNSSGLIVKNTNSKLGGTFQSLPNAGFKQEKISSLLNLLKKEPLVKCSVSNKSTIFNYIENSNRGGISYNNSYFFSQRSPKGRVIAWCAIFHSTKSRMPETLQELESFVRDTFNEQTFSLGNGKSAEYLDEYKTSLTASSYGGQEYDLSKIKKLALEPFAKSTFNEPLFFLGNDKSAEYLNERRNLLTTNSHGSQEYNLFWGEAYSDSEINAIKKIQQIYKLKQLWKQFVSNPEKYMEFSNDKLGHCMFGRHIAGTLDIKSSILYKEQYVTSDPYDSRDMSAIYYRQSRITQKDVFHMLPESQEGGLRVDIAGSGLTRWQFAIKIVGNNRLDITKSENANKVLSKYAKNGADVLKSKEFVLLLNCISKKNINFSLHAKEVYLMIERVCKHSTFQSLGQRNSETQERIKDNFARLHMFLDILVNLHNDTHIKFTAMLEPVIHELSLLIYEVTQLTKEPLITYEEFNESIQKEFLGHNGTAKIHKQNAQIDVYGYPANSGMHSHTLGLHLCKVLLDINGVNKDQYSFKEYGIDHYVETKDTRSVVLGLQKSDVSPSIHIVNGSIMNGFAPYTKGVELNNFVGELSDKEYFANNKRNIILLDNTNGNYKDLQLIAETQKLINDGLLTIIIWESWQKMGLLGTDQAQYGRTVVISNKANLTRLESFNQAAKKDIIKLDMQIGALLQVNRRQYNKYRGFNFENGRTLRSVLSSNPKDIEQTGPFLVNRNVKRALSIYKFSIFPQRDSFGFNYITWAGDKVHRISAGTEQNVDIKIFALALKKLVDNTKNLMCKETCFNNLIDELNNYFSELNVYQLNVLELMSYLMLAHIALSDPDYNQVHNKLEAKPILTICNLILRESDHELYKKFVNNHLERSKKSLSIITELKRELGFPAQLPPAH